MYINITSCLEIKHYGSLEKAYNCINTKIISVVWYLSDESIVKCCCNSSGILSICIFIYIYIYKTKAIRKYYVLKNSIPCFKIKLYINMFCLHKLDSRATWIGSTGVCMCVYLQPLNLFYETQFAKFFLLLSHYYYSSCFMYFVMPILISTAARWKRLHNIIQSI